MVVIASKLYKTQIDCSTYEPQIDSDDTEITITLLDFNNEPVSNEEVTVTCSGGLFWYVKRNQIDRDAFPEEVSTVTMRTNNNGQFILGYWANEWGFINIQANNTNIKLYVSGWREIELRKDIEYGIAPNEFINNNPFQQVIMRYDDSIHKMNTSRYYKRTQEHSLPYNQATTWLYFYTTDDNADSKLPSHILNSVYPQIRKFAYPEVIYYITKNPFRLNIRMVDDYKDTATFKITANTGITFFLESDYNYNEE